MAHQPHRNDHHLISTTQPGTAHPRTPERPAGGSAYLSGPTGRDSVPVLIPVFKTRNPEYRGMYRRRLIITLGSLSTVALAGCQEDDPDQQEAQNHYDDAVGALVENKAIFTDWAAGRPGRETSDIQAIRSRINQAETTLEDAASLASGDLADKVENLQAVAAFQHAQADFYDYALEYEAAVADAAAYGDAEQHQRAADEYQAAIDILEDAKSHLSTVESTHADIDPAMIDNPDLDYQGEYTTFFEIEAPETIDAQMLREDGNHHIHHIFINLNAGFEAFENNNQTEARTSFEDANDSVQAAIDAFEAIQDHEYAWQDLREESINLQGIVEDIDDAVDLFIDATHEAEAGNDAEATELAEEGWWLIEQAFE